MIKPFTKFYLLGVIFVFLGLVLKIPSFLLHEDTIFHIGFGFSIVGVVILLISFRRLKK